MPLYIVSTPIGNLDDISVRALKVLKDADIIAAEDTRHSGRLLKNFDIQTRMISYFDHNEKSRTNRLIEMLKEEKNVALISDAGTPGVADPAYVLVKRAVEENIQVIPVPGASAILSALVASGLPTDRFIFENFVPVKKGKRKDKFESLKDEERTIIFYESPHRILKTLNCMLEVYGDIKITIAREITKKFESIKTVELSEHIKEFTISIKGEFVIVYNLRVQN